MGVLGSVLRSLGQKEDAIYADSVSTTGACMVPCWQFFHGLADKIPKKLQAVLDIGCGTGRQMDVIVGQQKRLAEDGVYIGVDFSRTSMDFIRNERRNLMEDHRVHLLEDFAQTIREKLHAILDGRKLQATFVSIPHSLISTKDIHKIWKMIVECSAEDSMAILYNICSTRKLMEHYWKTVDSYMERRAHRLWLPPWFEVNVGRALRKKK